MNLVGSYRKLLENSKHAMIAAIEIYNKPKFEYREEVFSILISNAWELLLLAILSKNKQRIFEPKDRKKDYYMTLSFETAIRTSKRFFPDDISTNGVMRNIRLLRKYRNIAIHYYHETQHKHAIYMLAQASIRNYRDSLRSIFKQDIADEVNIILLPLSFNEQPDFVEFFKAEKATNYTPFVNELFDSLKELEAAGNQDTSRLITRCTIKIEATGNIKHADIIVGKNSNEGAHIVTRPMNPDSSHPFFQSDIVGDKKRGRHQNLRKEINSYVFQAIVWKHKIKSKAEYCWQSNKGGSPRYSHEIIELINSLTNEQIDDIRLQYSQCMHERRKAKKTKERFRRTQQTRTQN